MLKRLAPVLALFVLAPFIGELLLGSTPLNQPIVLPFWALLYGGGAVIIREVARRAGGGWPMIALLALAYGLIEEGLATQSLFNPTFNDQRLLDYGFIASLGTAPPWLIFVLVLHIAWSICVPIALAEALVPARRTTPWLRWPGLTVVTILYLLAVALIGAGTAYSEQFLATPAQLGAIVASVVAACVAAAALAARSRRQATTGASAAVGGPALAPVALGAVCFMAGSAFELWQYLNPSRFGLPPLIHLLGQLALAGIVAGTLIAASRRAQFGPIHQFAAAAGGFLVYCWWGFVITIDLHGAGAVPGHIALTLLALCFIVWLGLRVWRETRTGDPATAPRRHYRAA